MPTQIQRVFISHTSEFALFPEKRSFIQAAIAAINRAGAVPCDMGYFTARDERPGSYCKERVRECDVYVGIVGFRYGSPVRDRPEVSYTELEFEAASDPPAKQRLIFFLDQGAAVPVGSFSDHEFGTRQQAFRKRLSDANLTAGSFFDVHELEKLIYQALVEISGLRATESVVTRIDWPKEKSPYPGLLRFDQEYAPVFFGREREVDEIIAKMSEPMGRFVIVSGASGSGKSSLVDAGVWRGLIQDNRIAGSQDWIWLRIQPGDGETPFASLAWGLKQVFPKIPTRPPDVAKEVKEKQDELQELLVKHLAGDSELVLFIDQLEELFTRGSSASGIEAFLEMIIAATGIKGSRLRVLATVGNEFLGQLADIPVARELLNASAGYHLGTVSPRDLQDMIEKPAEVTGYRFEPDVVPKILAESHEPGQLPLAAYALNKLFERREGRVFTKKAYQEIGGVAGAIGTQAELAIALLDEATRAAFNRVFAQLVHVERDRPPTRNRASMEIFKADADARKLIEALAAADCRILVKDEATVSVSHEKLFAAWGRLSAWIVSGGDSLRLIEHAAEESHRWHQGGMQPKDLWSAERARDVITALGRFHKNPSETLERFLRPQAVLIEKLANDALSHEQRALIGMKLAEFGDPRQGVGLCADSLPDIRWSKRIEPKRIDIEYHGMMSVEQSFRIAVYTVTNAQFKAFLKAPDGYTQARWWQDLRRMEPRSPSWTYANHPRVAVSWYEAVAFCRWLTHRYKNAGLLGPEMSIRLPTESEWQLAATGGEPGREYPWPSDFDSTRCNTVESRLNRTTAVGIYLRGANPCDALDMAGNVWEWCLNKYDNPNDTHPEGGDTRVLRGGSWYYNRGYSRCAYRLWGLPDLVSYEYGFRVCCGLPISRNTAL